MHIEVDQSGKIEDTNKDTVVAFSNDISASIIIKAQDKRKIQQIFRKMGKHRTFVYRIFAILIFILIKSYIKNIHQIVIDIEYPGKDYMVKDFLLREIRKIHPNFSKEDILFRQIGKKSRAHDVAYNTFKKRRKADFIATKEISKFLPN